MRFTRNPGNRYIYYIFLICVCGKCCNNLLDYSPRLTRRAASVINDRINTLLIPHLHTIDGIKLCFDIEKDTLKTREIPLQVQL